MRRFYRLFKLDKSFLPNIVKGIESTLCKLTRVYLCIDLSEDIIPYISHSIQKVNIKALAAGP